MQVPKLKRAVIEIFGGCNYSCKMCPQTDGRDINFLKKMPLDVFENILDQLPGTPIINLEGSGEPSIVSDLPLYVEACTRRGLKSYMYCNGSKMAGQHMKDTVDAGLSFIRFSCIGYNREKYQHLMNVDNFDLIVDNCLQMKEYVAANNKSCIVSSYHLITDISDIAFEVSEYRRNFIDKIGIIGYIWKMHNWSGNYSPIYFRNPTNKKSCGRPFAPEITIRAGGIDGKYGAVTPCCQTLGSNEASSVLGHLSHESLENVWYGREYEKLRELHTTKDFDSILYCKNCDFLYEDPEVLVWSNDPSASTDLLLGTDFSLRSYK